MLDILNKKDDIKAFYVIFYNKEGHVKRIACELVSCVNECLILKLADKLGNFDYIETCSVNVNLTDGLYTSKTSIISVNNLILKLLQPKSLQRTQRREYFRADLKIPFTAELNLSTGQHKLIKGYTKNISGQGMAFVYESELPPCSNIMITLHFPEKEISSTARFVYTLETRSAFVHALNFNNISPKLLDYIVQQCFLFQIKKA